MLQVRHDGFLPERHYKKRDGIVLTIIRLCDNLQELWPCEERGNVYYIRGAVKMRYELTLEKKNGSFSTVLVEASSKDIISEWVENRNRGEIIVGCRETTINPRPSQSLIIL